MPHRSRLEGRARRLSGHACDGGLYHVTLCTYRRAELFGEVVDGVMHLDDAGGDVLSAWLDLPARYPHVELDVCMVMPDHVHAVVGLREGTEGRQGLCEVVRAWKTCSAHRINVRFMTPGARVWQRSFHDHAVRGPRDLERIRRYLIENPVRWTERYGNGTPPPAPPRNGHP